MPCCSHWYWQTWRGNHARLAKLDVELVTSDSLVDRID